MMVRKRKIGRSQTREDPPEDLPGWFRAVLVLVGILAVAMVWIYAGGWS